MGTCEPINSSACLSSQLSMEWWVGMGKYFQEFGIQWVSHIYYICHKHQEQWASHNFEQMTAWMAGSQNYVITTLSQIHTPMVNFTVFQSKTKFFYLLISALFDIACLHHDSTCFGIDCKNLACETPTIALLSHPLTIYAPWFAHLPLVNLLPLYTSSRTHPPWQARSVPSIASPCPLGIAQFAKKLWG